MGLALALSSGFRAVSLWMPWEMFLLLIRAITLFVAPQRLGM
jgi:hypothetical protein